MEVTLDLLLPRMLPAGVSFDVRVFAGKPDLLGKLAQRLRGYAQWAAAGGLGICVLVDEDREDCVSLKQRMEQAAREAGLRTRSSPGPNGRYEVVNRVVVEELEAWFLGDGVAVHTAFPSVPATFGQRRAYRDPDGVRGGTAEGLERLLQAGGHHAGGLRKAQAAQDIAGHLDPSRNTSLSFQNFRFGLAGLVDSIREEPKRA